MNINPKALISSLKDQHHVLQNDLLAILNLFLIEVGNNDEIIEKLNKFRIDLLAHFKLENEVFYPDYLDKLNKKGEDTKETKAFIQDMDVIGDVVMKFLDKYNSFIIISESLNDFKDKLTEISAMLKVRMETEEGIFGIYLTS
jgi:hypothetical protein